jgi:hypothetical protein
MKAASRFGVVTMTGRSRSGLSIRENGLRQPLPALQQVTGVTLLSWQTTKQQVVPVAVFRGV